MQAVWENIIKRIKKRMDDLKKIDPLNGASLLKMDASLAGGFRGAQGQEDSSGQAPDAGSEAGADTPAETSGGDGGDGGKDGAAAESAEMPTPTRKNVIKSLILAAIFAAGAFYVQLPALNLHDKNLYWMFIWVALVFCLCMIHLSGFRTNKVRGYVTYTRKKMRPFCYVLLGVTAIVVVGMLAGLKLFRAHDYAKLISVGEGDFAAEVAEISMSQIPLLDEDSANNLANRKLGELDDLVSQFSINNASTQINYNGAPVRVNYLDYGDFFKWWNNRGSGIPAYIRIDMRTQEVSVVRLEEGIKYSPSEYFNRNLRRHLRFQYPTALFGDMNFEIDESGTPYWVVSVVEHKIGLYEGADVVGVILMNAVTGESEYLDVADVPSWVDRVYSADLVVQQYNYFGKLKGGFWNSILGQNGCTETTSGYNFIAQDDDVWMYTGITSVTGDRGNIGFILVNQRTKETRYYSCAGAEEDSARSSAAGAVQQYSYTATFPILLNIADQPTYFMALKDAAGLVKMYAMVNVQQYQVVATGSTVAECRDRYQALLLENGITGGADKPDEPVTPPPAVQSQTVTGAIADIREANVDGDTIFYIQLEGGGVYYTISVRDCPILPILNAGERITVTYEESGGPLAAARTIETAG